MLEQTQNSAPQMPSIVQGTDYIDSDMGAFKRSSAQALADAQNQLNMAKYNNEYNYWLWQQQTKYNSPEQQVQRLKEAGLNPNFNSIEGAGNASSPSPSNGRLQTNFLGAYQADISARAQRLNEINSLVSGINDLVKNIGQGFDMARTYSQTPSGVSTYRSALHDLLIWNRNKAGHEASLKSIEDTVTGLLASYQGDKSLWGDDPYSNPLVQSQLGILGANSLKDDLAAMDLDIKKVVKDIKSYYHDKIQPEERRRIENQAELILSQKGYIDTQNESYNALRSAGILGPILVQLLRSAL